MFPVRYTLLIKWMSIFSSAVSYTHLAKAKVIPEAAKLDEYQKMSKEDLISAFIDARIREERLKLGYEVVEEDDSKKKLITRCV